jgi:hypothetical protein
MRDVPNFVLSAVSEFCPADACIRRVDKYRFEIQSRNAAALSLFTHRRSLELVLNETLVTSFQLAIASSDQASLSTYAENLRHQVAHQLKGRDTDPEVTIHLA